MTRNQYKSLAEKRAQTIRQLTRQLQAEKRLNNALSKLGFYPQDRQNPAKLKEVRKATTIKRNLLERRAA